MAFLPPTLRQRYFNAAGEPLAGGKIWSYQAGTTTPLPTFTDKTETTQNPNPLILDANGEGSMWLSSNAYKIVLMDSSDVVQWTVDNVRSAQSATFEDIQPLTTKGDLLVHTGSESSRFPVGSNGQVLIANSAEPAGLKWVSAAGGGGAENYITNASAEDNADGWTLNNITPAPFPSGSLLGSPAGLTLTRSTSSPLNGVASFELAKDGSNRQGQMLLTNFAVPIKSRAKVLSIRVPYRVVSGAFVNSTSKDTASLGVYIREFDGTNYTWTEPSSWRFLSNSTTVSDEFRAEFQTLSTTISADLVFYVGAFATGAWTIQIDDVNVGPSNYIYGTPVTDWTSYAPTITHTSGAATNYTTTAYWRRVGDSIDINGVIAFSAGSAVFNNIIVSLPTGRVIDTTKISGVAIGNGTFTDAGSGFLPLDVVYNTTTNFVIYTINSSGTYSTDNNITNAIPVTIAASDGINFQIKGLPIVGQSSSVQVSESTDTRVVSFVGTGAGGAVTANVTNIPTTAVRDSHGGWSGSVYTIFVPGDYQVSGYIEGASASSLFWYKNGVSQNYVNSIYASALGSAFSYTLHNLVAGDQISFRSNVSQTLVVFRLAISRISGPAAIAASEKIRLRYSCSTSPSINNTTPTITYDTRRYDTHLAYVGNEFRPPRADFYTFRGSFQTISHATTLNFLTSLQIFVDGVLVSHLSSFVAGTVNACRRTAQGTASLFLTTDNVVTFRFYSDTSTTLSSVVEANWIEVEGG